MASLQLEDGVQPGSSAPAPANGGMGFDVEVFREYLASLLAPGQYSFIYLGSHRRWLIELTGSDVSFHPGPRR